MTDESEEHERVLPVGQGKAPQSPAEVEAGLEPEPSSLTRLYGESAKRPKPKVETASLAEHFVRPSKDGNAEVLERLLRRGDDLETALQESEDGGRSVEAQLHAAKVALARAEEREKWMTEQMVARERAHMEAVLHERRLAGVRTVLSSVGIGFAGNGVGLLASDPDHPALGLAWIAGGLLVAGCAWWLTRSSEKGRSGS